jgi:hypothetical protein
MAGPGVKEARGAKVRHEVEAMATAPGVARLEPTVALGGLLAGTGAIFAEANRANAARLSRRRLKLT